MGTTGRRVLGFVLLLPVILLLLPLLDGIEQRSNGTGDGPGILLIISFAVVTLLSLWLIITKAPDPAKMSPRRVLLAGMGSRTLLFLLAVLPITGGLTWVVVGLTFFDLDPEADPMGWGGAILSGFFFAILMLINYAMLKACWEESGPPAHLAVNRLLRQPTTIVGVSDFLMSTHQDGSPMGQGEVIVEFMEGDHMRFYVNEDVGRRIVQVLRQQMAGGTGQGASV